MEVNKEEAIRCLHIAQRHRSSSNLPSALKFARKSVALYETPEGKAMITVIEREIETGGSSSSAEGAGAASTPNGTGTGGSTPASPAGARASGVEEHVTSAKPRAGHAASASAGKEKETPAAAAGKKTYTTKQIEVVRRVKACKHHEYYEILQIEKTCTENDVKKAYRKLALALHPDKNNAPGADEAFKMVSKAFQVLSDENMRAAFDSNPSADPTQRNAGMSRGGGGGMHFANGGGFQGDINPEDIFNMFFGGGMGGGGPFGGGFGGNGARVYTFGGPGGFQSFNNPRRRPAGANAGVNDGNTSPLIALLPVILLFAFAAISILPSLIFGPPPADPHYSFEPSAEYYDTARTTWHWGVPYWVNRGEWERSHVWESVPEEKRGLVNHQMYSAKAKSFERGVENEYVHRLQNTCDHFNALKSQRIANEAGLFGIGTDYDKIRRIRAEKNEACEQLKTWGVGQHNRGQNFY